MRRLAEQDSRFFSDRTHPARQFLDRITQRSLAFQSEKDEGWQRFLDTVQYGTRWLADSKVVDADIFGELLDHLQYAVGRPRHRRCASAARKPPARCCRPSSATCWRRSSRSRFRARLRGR